MKTFQEFLKEEFKHTIGFAVNADDPKQLVISSPIKLNYTNQAHYKLAQTYLAKKYNVKPDLINIFNISND